jgi:hypothetical protein
LEFLGNDLKCFSGQLVDMPNRKYKILEEELNKTITKTDIEEVKKIMEEINTVNASKVPEALAKMTAIYCGGQERDVAQALILGYILASNDSEIPLKNNYSDSTIKAVRLLMSYMKTALEDLRSVKK